MLYGIVHEAGRENELTKRLDLISTTWTFELNDLGLFPGISRWFFTIQ